VSLSGAGGPDKLRPRFLRAAIDPRTTLSPTLKTQKRGGCPRLGFCAVQSHDILYRLSLDILYTPTREARMGVVR